MKTTRYITSDLTSSAYSKRALAAIRAGQATYLTHLARLGEDGSPVAVVCRGAKPASICEDMLVWSHEAPTCPACAARFAALAAVPVTVDGVAMFEVTA